MSHSFLIANAIKHQCIYNVSLGRHTLRYANGPENQLKICFKYSITLNSKDYWRNYLFT